MTQQPAAAGESLVCVLTWMAAIHGHYSTSKSQGYSTQKAAKLSEWLDHAIPQLAISCQLLIPNVE
eukprot:10759553-Karenia_brevis.AAC.1